MEIITQFTRECPNCKKTLFHKTKYARNWAEKQKRICRNCDRIINPRRCSKEQREKLSILAYERFKNYTPEQWEKMRVDGHKYNLLQPKLTEEERLAMCGENNHFYGKTHTDEVKKKVGAIWRGKKLSLEHRLKISEGLKRSGANTGDKNPAKRPEVRQKIRKTVLHQLETIHGNITPSFNPIACKYFDELNNQNGWNLQHALNGGEVYLKEIGYWLDAYDKERNIIVEYDESKHYKVSGELKEKDVRRMNEIITRLNCCFYRYNEKTGELYQTNSTP